MAHEGVDAGAEQVWHAVDPRRRRVAQILRRRAGQPDAGQHNHRYECCISN